MVAADYPFLDVLWTMLIIFAWIIWFWLLITVFTDLFRRHDTSGFAKVLWIIFVIVLPFLGVLIYLIANSKGMTERRIAEAQAAQAQFDEYVKTTAGGGGGAAAEIEKANAQRAQMDDYVRNVAGSGGAAGEIEKAKGLLDSGAITQAEFESMKAKALAAS